MDQRQSIYLGFKAYQPLKVIKCQIHFYTNKQFYFKQFNFKLFILVKKF